MHIRDIFAPQSTTFSFEFFPAKTSEADARLKKVIEELAVLSPAFVSVTYGAGGSTRDATQELIGHLKQNTALNPVPHLTCVRQQQSDIEEILTTYAQNGVSNILALRGDPPKDSPNHDHRSDALPFGADLVRFIRQFNDRGIHKDARGFGIGVAGFPEGHPHTPNRLQEMDNLKAKVDAGADYIFTQLFFDNNDFLDFCERCELAGIHIPILAGILPVNSISGLRRMAELSGGTRIPAHLLKALKRVETSPEAVAQVGLHHATEQCADLLRHNVAGIHFYTLNQSQAILEIMKRLGLYVN